MTMKETGQYIGRNRVSITMILTAIGIVGGAFYGFGQIAESDYRFGMVYEIREGDKAVVQHVEERAQSLHSELSAQIVQVQRDVKEQRLEGKRNQRRSLQQLEIDLQLAIPELESKGVDTTAKKRKLYEIRHSLDEVEAEIERLEDE